jgi:dolichol-phosphate mannosyltransferase
MAEITVIIPTYRESENIEKILQEVSKQLSGGQYNYDILVIDDNSPDATMDIAENFFKNNGYGRVLSRRGKRGLGLAVKAGFGESSSNILVVMDADFTHPPENLFQIIDPLRSQKADIVIGSRYLSGSSWGEVTFLRKAISRCGVILGRMLFPQVSDPSSGFFGLHKSVLEGIELSGTGFKICAEILAKGKYMRVKEIPYRFQERKLGKSKFSPKIGWQYLKQLAEYGSLRFRRII